MLNNKFGLQKNLFNALARYGNNFCSVFESLPRNSRMIYGHALQSYIWNSVASKRVKNHGTKVIIGDLVAQSQAKE
jgi:tRNA pseudouridine13 synthase